MLRSSLACTPKAGVDSMISLVASDTHDLIHLPAGHSNDAIGQWLANSEAAEKGAPMSPAARKEAAAVIKDAFASKDKSEATIKKAMSNHVKRWRTKRRALKQHLAKNTSALRGLQRPLRPGAAPQLPIPTAPPMAPRSPAAQASMASCVFDVTQAVTQIAALAANIADAANTCPHVDHGEDRWAVKTCAVNVQAIIQSAATIAATLSLAANNCADTFEPNLDALCAGSIAGMVQSVSELAVSSNLLAGACGPHIDDELAGAAGVTASNIGQYGRRLGEHNETQHADARRLLIGGGKDSTGAFCAVDITSALWYLAEAGLAINAAANRGAGQACPVRTHFEGEPIRGMDYRRSKAFCAVDVAGAIYGFLQAIYYLFFSVVHCMDVLDTDAICGAGVTGLLASLDGMALSGSSIWLACEDLKTEWPNPSSPLTQHMLENNVLGQSGQMGRRLTAEVPVGGVAQFKDKFSTPMEAFASLGFDITSKDADFRKARPAVASPQDVLDLLEEEPTIGSQAKYSEGLLGGLQQCA